MIKFITVWVLTVQATDLELKQNDRVVKELQKGASITNHRIEL